MLKSLTIENYAIIESVRLDFHDKLNIITGETGAGKSIILGALGLIMGQRADSKVLFNKDKKCIIEATFTGYPTSTNSLLEDNDYDTDPELIIRREIAPAGKSRAFVNDTPSKIDFLQKLSLELLDVNQQLQIHDIVDKDFQIAIIDSLAKNDKTLNQYRSVYKQYRSKTKELNDIESIATTQLKELEFMKFQFSELDKAAIEIKEQEQLESEQEMLEKADEFASLSQETNYLLIESENNVRDILSSLGNKWANYSHINPEIEKLYADLDAMVTTLESLGSTATDIAGDIENNPVRLTEVSTRLDLLYSLQKKHGVQTLQDLLQIQSDLGQQVSGYSNREETIKTLKSEITVLEKELNTYADKISASRKKVFPKLQKVVNTKLTDLSMASAEIKIDCQRNPKLKADGYDDINILFKSNKGSDFSPIKKVASGGEMSRLMLSIKASVAHAMALPTMVFDEIDTGVSGDVAGKMGTILRDLADQHQLICITHSPQVSAMASKHMFVYKEDTKSRTITHVKVLTDAERVTEIATMLSGNPPSTFALENAKELLGL